MVDKHEFVFVHTTSTDRTSVAKVNRQKIQHHIRSYVRIQQRKKRSEFLDIRVVSTSQMARHTGGLSTKTSQHPFQLRIPPSPSSVDYAAAASRYNFDVRWVSSLTISSVGSFRITDSMPAWIRHAMPSFLDFVAIEYAHSHLLRCVVDSLLARAAYVLAPSRKTRIAALEAYGTGLKEVQKSLVDPRLKNATEMVCTIRLLQLYELVGETLFERSDAHSETRAWSTDQLGANWKVSNTNLIGTHSRSMQDLVMRAGPAYFTTSLGKSIICSLIGNFFISSIAMCEGCFLESPIWQVYLASVTDETQPGQHPTTISLWLTLVKFPRLLRQTNDYVMKQEHGIEGVGLMDEIRDFKADLAQKLRACEACDSKARFGTAFFEEYCGAGMAAVATVCRLLIALNPAAADAFQLEEEAQQFARRTSECVTDQIVSSGFFCGLVIRATSEEWRMAIREACHQKGVLTVNPKLFEVWYQKLHRRAQNEKQDSLLRYEVDNALRNFVYETTYGTLESTSSGIQFDENRASTNKSMYRGVVWYT